MSKKINENVNPEEMNDEEVTIQKTRFIDRIPKPVKIGAIVVGSIVGAIFLGRAVNPDGGSYDDPVYDADYTETETGGES